MKYAHIYQNLFSSGTDLWIWPLQRMLFSVADALRLNLPLVRLPCEQLKTAVSIPVIGRLGLSLAKVYGTWFQRKIIQLQVKLSLKTELALISINTL